MNPLKLARLSLSRHLFATIITIIAIGMSVACGGILLRLYELSEARFSTIADGGDAVIGAKAGGIEILLGSLNGEGKYPDFLPYRLFESLRAEQTIVHEDGTTSTPSSIDRIVPFVYFAKYDNYRVVGTDDTFLGKGSTEKKIADGKWFTQPGEVVIGSGIARSKKLKAGDTFRIHPWFGGEPLASELEVKVTGVLEKTKSQWDNTVFASVDSAHRILASNMSAISAKSIWGADVLNYFLVYLHPNGFASLEALVNRRTVGQIIQVSEEKAQLKEISGAGKSVGLFVTVFVILLGGLSVCSMLVTRFEGMSLQLAVLRALGYTKSELSKWLLWEGFILGLFGVILGAIIDMIGFPILRVLLGSSLPPDDLVSSSILQSSPIWLMAIAATVLSVFIPMARMARQDTHTSLKG